MPKRHKENKSIHNSTRAIVKELGDKLGVEFDQNALSIIGELAYKRLVIYGSDLDAFQKHAKKLLVRRNDSLTDLLETKLNMIISLKPQSEGSNTAKRKRK